ncbi:MAG: GNAT family N-acetyltransferase [Promethearchaeota archaeon]|jgi:ribosomal protein S18 acetylase RimI-like enzyme
MKSKREIKRFQEFLMNSWPAKHYYFLNGWVLRFTDGVTDRANSVFPIEYTGNKKNLKNDIDNVERAYKAHSLQPVFTIPESHNPKNLVDNLLSRGYQKYDHTRTLSIKIGELRSSVINEEFEYTFFNSRVKNFSDFLAKFSKRSAEDLVVINEVSQRTIIPKKCFIVGTKGNEVIGTLMAVLVPQGFLYVGDVFVHPDFRRQGVATSMLNKLKNEWSLSNEVKTIWLQVEKVNTNALDLYLKLGMTKLYDYFYMKMD